MAQSKFQKIFSRQILPMARLLHVYVSASLFALMLFFCLTGYFLNHQDLFGNSGTEKNIEFELDEKVINSLNSAITETAGGDNELRPDTLLHDLLAQRFGLTNPTSVDLDEDMGEIFLNYSLPAGYATAAVSMTDAVVTLDYRNGNTTSLLNDLHKGRHSGAVWSWIIDVSAWLMIFFSMTGFLLLFQNKRQRRLTLALAGLGAVTPVLFYFLWVPRLTGV